MNEIIQYLWMKFIIKWNWKYIIIRLFNWIIIHNFYHFSFLFYIHSTHFQFHFIFISKRKLTKKHNNFIKKIKKIIIWFSYNFLFHIWTQLNGYKSMIYNLLYILLIIYCLYLILFNLLKNIEFEKYEIVYYIYKLYIIDIYSLNWVEI